MDQPHTSTSSQVGSPYNSMNFIEMREMAMVLHGISQA